MKREKKENRGTFCIEVWVTLDEDNRTRSCHVLKKEDQLICEDFPNHGETHILNALHNEYLKRETYFDLLTKLTEDPLLVSKCSSDEALKSMIRMKMKEDVIAQITKNIEGTIDSTVEMVLNDFIKRTSKGR